MAAPEGYKALGKIGISYKGDYNPNTVYERLDAVYHNGSTYLAIKDAPDGAPRNDKINWIYLAKGYDGETVDVAESEIVFTESETRENIGSGEKVSTVFGKIKKFFTDLTAPAFAQMITTKEDLLATKVTGYVPDAKAVADAYTELNGKLVKVLWTNPELDGTANLTPFAAQEINIDNIADYTIIGICHSDYARDRNVFNFVLNIPNKDINLSEVFSVWNDTKYYLRSYYRKFTITQSGIKFERGYNNSHTEIVVNDLYAIPLKIIGIKL